jgi:hypothetical protein
MDSPTNRTSSRTTLVLVGGKIPHFTQHIDLTTNPPITIEVEDEILQPRRIRRQIIPKCVICLEQEVTMQILPCNHICMCEPCSQTCLTLTTYSVDCCPMCRYDIDSVVKIFITGHND